jgi:hypothetical protein
MCSFFSPSLPYFGQGKRIQAKPNG